MYRCCGISFLALSALRGDSHNIARVNWSEALAEFLIILNAFWSLQEVMLKKCFTWLLALLIEVCLLASTAALDEGEWEKNLQYSTPMFHYRSGLAWTFFAPCHSWRSHLTEHISNVCPVCVADCSLGITLQVLKQSLNKKTDITRILAKKKLILQCHDKSYVRSVRVLHKIVAYILHLYMRPKDKDDIAQRSNDDRDSEPPCASCLPAPKNNLSSNQNQLTHNI